MPTNVYFDTGTTSEQRLYENIIIEQLRAFGQDVYYLPRKLVKEDTLFGEDTLSSFNDAYIIEMYLDNFEGFEGQKEMMTRFGLDMQDEATWVVSKRRFEQLISTDQNLIVSTRPNEGDLIYFPLDNTMFEIKYVEGKKPFYQLNNLYVYTLSCEVMDYALDENIDTGIEAVDKAAVEFGYTTRISMVSIAASTASATVQLSKNAGNTNVGKGIAKIDLINDGTGYTLPPLIGISSAPSDGINATAVAIMTSRCLLYTSPSPRDS